MRVGYEIAKEFYDAAVSGADALASRAGFAAMLKRIEGNGEFDKAMTVAKLRGAGERKRATGVNVEGRKSQTELRPEVVAEAKFPAQNDLSVGRGRIAIASELFQAGYRPHRIEMNPPMR